MVAVFRHNLAQHIIGGARAIAYVNHRCGIDPGQRRLRFDNGKLCRRHFGIRTGSWCNRHGGSGGNLGRKGFAQCLATATNQLRRDLKLIQAQCRGKTKAGIIQRADIVGDHIAILIIDGISNRNLLIAGSQGRIALELEEHTPDIGIHIA